MNSAASCPPARPRRSRWFAVPTTALFWLFGAGVVAAVLYWFDPALGGFYPSCVFYRLTGWQCPGCGGLRAAHQLLHGHWIEAARLNALLVAALPLLAWLAVEWFAHVSFRRARHKGTVHPALAWVGLGAAVVFGVARNLSQ